MTQQCEAEVWEPPGYWHTHRCPRNAKCQVGTKWLCSQHAKGAERRAAFAAMWNTPRFDAQAARDAAAETAYPTDRGGHDHGD